ncbi:MAG: hypothetical protein ACOY45_16965 [Pseudomonadota bacterium]
MTDAEKLARGRYFAMTGLRIVAALGATLGLLLIGRADATAPKVLGGAIILSSLYFMAVVPAALARRWRTPPEA